MSDVLNVSGVASIAILPDGSLAGHLVERTADGACRSFGLLAREVPCDRECSAGLDWKLLRLHIVDFANDREAVLLVERTGYDMARLQAAHGLPGWEVQLSTEAARAEGTLQFECTSLKADAAADEHLAAFHPKLVGTGAVVNVGSMDVQGLRLIDRATAAQQSAQRIVDTQLLRADERVVDTPAGASDDEFGFSNDDSDAEGVPPSPPPPPLRVDSGVPVPPPPPPSISDTDPSAVLPLPLPSLASPPIPEGDQPRLQGRSGWKVRRRDEGTSKRGGGGARVLMSFTKACAAGCICLP